jgi:hypothetical protein
VEKGKLAFSSGSIEHLAKTSVKGEVLIWPWVELSLTPTPANLLAEAGLVTKHFETAGLKMSPQLTDALKAAETAADDDDDAAETPADGERAGDGLPEGSYEDLMNDLNRLIRSAFRDNDEYLDYYSYVVATFPDYAIACCSGRDPATEKPISAFYRVAYTVAANGEPVLGEMRQVQRVYKSLELPLIDEAPLAIQAARLSTFVLAISERTQGLAARRSAEHRVLSERNREVLTAAVKASDDALSALRSLIESATPALAEAARAEIDELELLQLYAASLSTS